MRDAPPLWPNSRSLFQARKFPLLEQPARSPAPVETPVASRIEVSLCDPKVRLVAFGVIRLPQFGSRFVAVQLAERASRRTPEELVRREIGFGLLAQHALHSAEGAHPNWKEQFLKRLPSP